MAAGHGGAEDWDEALTRLEEFLLAYPAGRALPDPETIATAAALPPGFLVDDDRARKVLLDAVAHRPLGTFESVSEIQTEVELLTLEVRAITGRLASGRLSDRELDDHRRRLARVRSRLEQIRGIL
jgi:hypothetical protein